MNRPDLFALVGQRVTITSPSDPVTGRLAAYVESPTLIVDLDDGRRAVLPQYRCKVTPADGTPPEPAAWDRQIANGGDLLKDLQDAQRKLRQDDLIAQLGNMTANLQAHIDERAHELAAPRIADVEERAAEQLAVARDEVDHWRQRFTDLQNEYRRQLQVADRRAVRAETAIARALATLALNVQLQADDPGYQACADHVQAALHGTEGTPA